MPSRAEARLLATMALVRESRARLELEFEGEFEELSCLCPRPGNGLGKGLTCAGLRVEGAMLRFGLGLGGSLLAGDFARGDCVEEADTKLSSDEAELCDSVCFGATASLTADALGGACGGSSLGDLTTFRGSGETNSGTGRRAWLIG